MSNRPDSLTLTAPGPGLGAPRKLEDKFGRPLEWGAIVILAVTGLLKLVASFQPDKIMQLDDPVFMIGNRELFTALGALELASAYYLFVSSNRLIKTLALAWLLACFLVYRLAWHLSGTGETCPCLGTGYGWAPWLKDHLSQLSLGTIAGFALVVALRAILYFTSLRSAPAAFEHARQPRGGGP